MKLAEHDESGECEDYLSPGNCGCDDCDTTENPLANMDIAINLFKDFMEKD